MTRDWKERPSFVPGAKCWTDGKLNVALAQEEGRWHMSISRPDGTYATYDDIADARYDLAPPGIDMAMFLPPLSDYINLVIPGTRTHTFHLWEVRDPECPIQRGYGMRRTHENGLTV